MSSRHTTTPTSALSITSRRHIRARTAVNCSPDADVKSGDAIVSTLLNTDAYSCDCLCRTRWWDSARSAGPGRAWLVCYETNVTFQGDCVALHAGKSR